MNEKYILPVVPVRGLVVFPHMTLNFDVGRVASIKALHSAAEKNTEIFLVAQRDIDAENPTADELFDVGTVATIKQVMNKPGNVVRVIVEGVCRARLGEVVSTKPFIEAYADVFHEEFEGDRHLEAAYIRRLKKILLRFTVFCW